MRAVVESKATYMTVWLKPNSEFGHKYRRALEIEDVSTLPARKLHPVRVRYKYRKKAKPGREIWLANEYRPDVYWYTWRELQTTKPRKEEYDD